MIRLLFLDDSKERHDRFKKWINSRAIAENIQFSPVYVYTAKDAIMALRYKKGTPEYLWYKWYNKLWKSYVKHHNSKRGEPPSFMRDEFIRDIKLYALNETKLIILKKTSED